MVERAEKIEDPPSLGASAGRRGFRQRGRQSFRQSVRQGFGHGTLRLRVFSKLSPAVAQSYGGREPGRGAKPVESSRNLPSQRVLKIVPVGAELGPVTCGNAGADGGGAEVGIGGVAQGAVGGDAEHINVRVGRARG